MPRKNNASPMDDVVPPTPWRSPADNHTVWCHRCHRKGKSHVVRIDCSLPGIPPTVWTRPPPWWFVGEWEAGKPVYRCPDCCRDGLSQRHAEKRASSSLGVPVNARKDRL